MTPLQTSGTDCGWRSALKQEILLEEVSFRYAPDRPWALTRVSLRFPPVQAVGIVGVNGSGKTTLVDVIVGCWCPLRVAWKWMEARSDEANRAAWQSRIPTFRKICSC